MKFSNSISSVDRVYREFACWAARRAAQIAKCKSDDPIVLMVEKYMQGEIDFDELVAAREVANARTSGAIGAAGIIGTRVRGVSAGKVNVLNLISPVTAAHLAASSCADDSARMAAESAIKYGALTARSANRWSAVSSEGKERALLETELQGRLEAFVKIS